MLREFGAGLSDERCTPCGRYVAAARDAADRVPDPAPGLRAPGPDYLVDIVSVSSAVSAPPRKPFHFSGRLTDVSGILGQRTEAGRMDPEATLERLYRDEGARLWWAVVAFSGDRAIADDAVAEAFAQAIVRGADLRDPLAWIWSVAFRLARGELKRRAQQTHVLPETYVATDPRPAEVVEALRALPERQRAAVVLFYYADRSVREVAEILGVRVSTTKVHLHRGRNRLRDLLEAPDD